MDGLDHEKLDVYRCSIQLLAIVLGLVKHFPRAETELRDQIRRAAMSIPLNIAEGVGKTSAADRARFHASARGSAFECAAIMDVCAVASFLPATEVEQAKELLHRIVSMLTKMCR